MKYRQSIRHQVPKTIRTKLASILRYFESNQIYFNDNLKRNLYGTGSNEAISKEKVPGNEELAKLVEYIPFHIKTLTMVLASIGMRIGESLHLTMDYINLGKDPARINIRAEYTKTRKKRNTFLSAEAKEQFEAWLRY
ncbi:tyrosine-type recombinase/integrase [Candidatus Bathyarchaeota archaeon]|nr:tyrosine-type recombinase/integrase [Candidatus Bathyarchaeota archaeon]